MAPSALRREASASLDPCLEQARRELGRLGGLVELLPSACVVLSKIASDHIAMHSVRTIFQTLAHLQGAEMHTTACATTDLSLVLPPCPLQCHHTHRLPCTHTVGAGSLLAVPERGGCSLGNTRPPPTG